MLLNYHAGLGGMKVYDILALITTLFPGQAEKGVLSVHWFLGQMPMETEGAITDSIK